MTTPAVAARVAASLAVLLLGGAACDRKANTTGSPSASAAASASARKTVSSLQPRPNPSALQSDDPRVVSARAQAQASLGTFVEELSKPDQFRNRHFAVLITRPNPSAPAPSASSPGPVPTGVPTGVPSSVPSSVPAGAASGAASGQPATGAPATYSLWVTVVSHQDGVFTCRVDKPRAELPKLAAASSLKVAKADVQDWRITGDSGKIFGSYLLRATLSALPPEVRAATESVLQPLPKTSAGLAGAPPSGSAAP